MKNSDATTEKSGKKTGAVKSKKSAATDLRKLFVNQLKDILWAERALVKALPKLANNADDAKLTEAIEQHITITEDQIKRLENVFEILGETARGKKCEAMEGLIKEGESILEETELGPVRDAGIIAASQKIEHYEIASYGSLCAFAKTLGEDEVAGLLGETLEEEKEADRILTESAYNNINFEAADEDEQE